MISKSELFVVFQPETYQADMRFSVVILYLSAWILYVVFSILMFPVIKISVSIPVVVLTGLGAWLFGRKTGLIILIPLICYQAFLTSYLYADLLEVYVYKFSGIAVLITIALLIGSLKNHYSAITQATRELDLMVEERSKELQQLTSELLNNAEQQRVAKGQELHDGMGQQLTGVQLLCASILDQLELEGNDSLPLARNLEKRTCQTHNHIRRLARMLFPVRISQVGLLAAVSELASCIKELKPIEFEVKELADLRDVPESTALQMYRICQESALHVIDNTDADMINVILNVGRSHYTLGITHNGRAIPSPGCESILKLIHYRLNRISGSLHQTDNEKGLTTLAFNIPKPMYSAT